jgi:threonine aldolase
LVGNASFIKKARRWRKVFGGGMRQAGSLAAAGIYALDHHVDRLIQDHQKALLIKEALVKKDFVTEVFEVETNIVIAKIEGKFNATQLASVLKEQNILVIAMTPALVRFVLHLDITDEMLSTTIATIEKL